MSNYDKGNMKRKLSLASIIDLDHDLFGNANILFDLQYILDTQRQVITASVMPVELLSKVIIYQNKHAYTGGTIALSSLGVVLEELGM